MTSSEYYAKWYQANKERLAEKRRERYTNDPAYRSKAIALATQYRSGSRVMDESVELNGETVKLFPVNELAQALDVERLTITNWELRGLFPVTPYLLTANNKRYYTQGMIDVAKAVVEARRNGAKRIRVATTDATMLEEIRLAWRELGVPV
jgi:hypothetical protein